MDEITSPPEESLEDKYSRKIKEYEEHNASLERPVEAAPQQQEEDEFSDIGDVAREIGSALVGGLQQTGSDLVTLPERAIDMARGEDVGSEDYRPDMDIFGAFENPIETRTWWGGVLKTLVNYGSLAFVPIPGARIRGIQKATGLAQMGRAALVGAKVDLIASGSQEENASAVIAEHFPQLRTPLATKDTDPPAMKTLKNVVEGMGIGAVIDGLGIVLKGARGADDALKRTKSIEEQTVAKGIDEVAESPEAFRGHANKPVADPPQGSPTSNGSAGDVNKQLSRTRNELGAEGGSTDSLTRPIELDRIGKGNPDLAASEVKRIMEDFMSTDYVIKEVAKAKKMGVPLHEVWGDATASMKEMFEGRLRTDLTPREWADNFYKQGIKRKVKLEDGSFEEIEIMDPNMIPANDLLRGSLLKEIRDLGVAGRELQDLYDLGDTDGPAKALFDKFASLTAIAARSRRFAGYDLVSIKGVDGVPKKADFEKAVNEDVQKSIDAFRTAFQMAGESGDNELFKAYMEVASMLDDVTNLNDLDNFFRKKLRGGMLDGKKQTGELIRELEGVMIHSVLSGPKTPIRAIMGTASATFLRPMATALGATFAGDVVTRKASLAALNGMMGMLPEAFTLFRKKLDGYFSGDIATIQSRYVERTKADQQWKMYGDWAEKRGTAADKAVYRFANMARNLNDNNFLTYSTKIMAATDDVFGHILARGKMRERAMREALEQASKGDITEITPAILKKAEDKFAKQILDEDGNIIDDAVKYAKRESTLTKDLEGFSKGLETLFNQNPWAKPFFLFARTGVNGLELTAKYTPGFNFLVKEFNDIALASIKDVEAGNLTKYGISTFEELQNAKALQNGRLAIGSAVVTMASMMWMSGNMTGDGPTDRQMRQSWIDAGWKPRTFTLGGVQIGYEAFEPFNQIMATISNIGDHSLLMGDEWTEGQLQKLALVVGQSAASKSYLAGLQQFVDLFSNQPGQHNRIIASLMNNTLPMSSMRNEIGKLFTPYMRELDSGIADSIRNRNLLTEKLTDEALPIKYDMLNGQPIKDYDFITRAWNMFSPVQFNLDQGPGRKLLFRSGYDTRLSVYYAPDSTDLSKLPGVRSKFQKAIGDQNLEAQLNELAADPRIQASIRKMEKDRASGNRDYEPMKAYYHTKRIGEIFNRARKRAWATIRADADVRAAIAESRADRIENRQSQRQTTYGELEPALKMYR